MQKDVFHIFEDSFFPKLKLSDAIRRADGAEVARLVVTHQFLSDDFYAQGMDALSRLGAAGIKRLLIDMRVGVYYYTAGAADTAYLRGRVATCLANIFSTVKNAGLALPVIQALALTVLSDLHVHPGEAALEALRTVLPQVKDAGLHARLKNAAKAVVTDPDAGYHKRGKALLDLLRAQDVLETTEALQPMLPVPVGKILARQLRIELMDRTATYPNQLSDNLKRGIQLSKTNQIKSAEYYFSLAALEYGSPLLSGFAKAQAGAMNIKLGELGTACRYFRSVLDSHLALVESVHQACGYLTLILAEAGRRSESALLALQVAQTEALLGYRLGPEVEREVRQLTRAYRPC